MWELHWHCPTAGTTSLMWPNTQPQQRPFVLCLGKVRIFWRFEEILIVLIYHRSQKVLSSNHEQRFSYVYIYIYLYISDLLSLNLFFSLVSYSADFQVFLRRWIHKLDKKVWILLLYKSFILKKIRKTASRMPSKKENEWFLTDVGKKHLLMITTLDRTDFIFSGTL